MQIEDVVRNIAPKIRLSDEQVQFIATNAVKHVDGLVLAPVKGCPVEMERAYQIALKIRNMKLEVACGPAIS